MHGRAAVGDALDGFEGVLGLVGVDDRFHFARGELVFGAELGDGELVAEEIEDELLEGEAVVVEVVLDDAGDLGAGVGGGAFGAWG